MKLEISRTVSPSNGAMAFTDRTLGSVQPVRQARQESASATQLSLIVRNSSLSYGRMDPKRLASAL